MRSIRLALAQINSIVGDLKGNFQKTIDYINSAVNIGAEIIAFPSLIAGAIQPIQVVTPAVIMEIVPISVTSFIVLRFKV